MSESTAPQTPNTPKVSTKESVISPKPASKPLIKDTNPLKTDADSTDGKTAQPAVNKANPTNADGVNNKPDSQASKPSNTSLVNDKTEAKPTTKPANQNIQNNQPSPSRQTTTIKPQSPKPIPKNVSVKISIMGKTYTITCPEDEQDELQTASRYIDNFVQDIRNQAPHLSHENLLVLCCLNLYAESQGHQQTAKRASEEAKQIHTLLDKVLSEMQAL